MFFGAVFGIKRFDKPPYLVYNAASICRIERFGRFGDGRFGRQGITTPSIKTHNHPLSSTFYHEKQIKKISVRNIKPQTSIKRYQISLPNPICDGI
jgi:hypothetical protein